MSINTDELVRQLHDYAVRAEKVMSDISKFSEVQFDHISVLTKSSEDYESMIDAFKDKVKKINEIPHAGRRIFIGRLNEPIEINDKLTINTIEISEPKPKRVVEENGIDHISFFIKNCSELGDKLNEEGYKVYDFKTISNTKLFKLKVDDLKLEFRDRKLEDAEINDEPQSNVTNADNNELEEAVQAKLRAIADYQNLKRQVEEERKYFVVIANAALLGRIIDIMDDFERAMEQHKDGLDEGIKMISTKLHELLNDYGVEEMKTNVGDKLDPNMHEAVGVVNPDNDDEVNTIKQIVQKGFKFKHNDQVVRPARVIVAKKL